MKISGISNSYYTNYRRINTSKPQISFRAEEKNDGNERYLYFFGPNVCKAFPMKKSEWAKNFSLNKEISVAGKFIYDGMKDLNEMSGLRDTENLFGFLYKTSVGIERLQKVAYILLKNPDDSEYKQVEEEIITHSHGELQNKIKKLSGKDLPSNQNDFLKMLSKFYKTYRYNNFTLDNDLEGEGQMLAEFLNKNLGKDFSVNSYLNPEIDEQSKRFLGKIIKKISKTYYDIIVEQSDKLGLYTYETAPYSKSEAVFGVQEKEGLQRQMDKEQLAAKELILFLMNTKESSKQTEFMKTIPPLDMDIALAQEYLGDIVKGKIPQGLVDEVETIYMDMDKKELKERREKLSLIGNPNCYFDDEEI